MEYEKQIRYNDRQMQRYQAYLSKVQKINRLDKRTKEMTIGDVIKKSILPLAFMVFWFWMTKTIMKVSGQTDWFCHWIFPCTLLRRANPAGHLFLARMLLAARR